MIDCKACKADVVKKRVAKKLAGQRKFVKKWNEVVR